jgi:cytochrome P450
MSARPSIPSPPATLFFGHLAAARERPLEYSLEITREFGDIVELRLGPSRMVLVNHPDYVQRVLQENHANYGRPAFVALMRRIVGNGLLFSEGESWLRQRRLMQPSFHREQLARYSEVMAQVADERVSSWRARASHGPLDMTREAADMAYRVVGPTLFGDEDLERAEELVPAITTTLRWLDSRTQNPVAMPLFVPTRENREFKRALATFSRIVDQLIQLRRTRPASDLLSTLIGVRDADSGEGMTDAQLRDEVLTFLIAGLETTSAALTWAFVLLAQHPNVLAQVRAEHRAVCGDNSPRPEDASQMPLARMVIQEALRLYPPAFGLTRQARGNDSIGGYPIERGTQILISTYALHRSPSLWEKPDEFAPELHFAPHAVSRRPRYAFIPFGAGPRLCIGQAFAMMELQTLVPRLASAFDFELVGEVPKAETSMTLRAAGPVFMRLRTAD